MGSSGSNGDLPHGLHETVCSGATCTGSRRRGRRGFGTGVEALRSLESGSINSKLDGVGGRTGSKVIATSLEASLPSIEVHGSELRERGVGEMDVKGLGLVNESSSVSRKVDDSLLRNLPDCSINLLEIIGDVGDGLNGTAGGNDKLLHVVVPKVKVDEVSQQPRADHLEIARKYPSSVKHRSVRFKAKGIISTARKWLAWNCSPFVPTQDLRS